MWTIFFLQRFRDGQNRLKLQDSSKFVEADWTEKQASKTRPHSKSITQANEDSKKLSDHITGWYLRDLLAQSKEFPVCSLSFKWIQLWWRRTPETSCFKKTLADVNPPSCSAMLLSDGLLWSEHLSRLISALLWQERAPFPSATTIQLGVDDISFILQNNPN